jgi:maleylacetoacetate isomerase
MKLSTYFRSSAAWRVRIALSLKGIAATPDFVHLLKDGGQQKGAAFRRKNPMGVVPVLELDDGTLLTQSLGIIEYLEESHPTPALLPSDPVARAKVRAFALAIACDIHPLNNLRVLKYLKGQLGRSQEEIDAWYAHWISEGLPALETIAKAGAGNFLFGDMPTIADVCLLPQLYNARRYNVPLDAYPTLLRADENASKLDAFAAAHPDRQKVPA